MWNTILLSKSAGVGILAGLWTASFFTSVVAFIPVAVLGFSSVYYLGNLNQRIKNIEQNNKEIISRLDRLDRLNR